MKSTLKVCNIYSMNDVNRIRQAISYNQGIIACQINIEKGQISIVYDDYFITIDCIEQSLEDLGYTVI